MEKSDIIIMGNKQFPAIGYGPGIMGESYNYKIPKKGIASILYRVWNKLYLRPMVRKKYVNAIIHSLRLGYRLFDYSAAYGNEKVIGEAIKKSGIDRNELFITTRISNKAQLNKTVRDEFFKSLNNMGLKYVDLLQFHWPVSSCYLETWKEMEKLYEEGYVKHLGVANCHQHHIEEILRICKYKPEIGQFECHPLFSQKDLIDFYKSQKILVEAYTPTARFDDRLVRLPLLKTIAEHHKKSLSQIIFRWHIQNGVVPLTRTWNPKHIDSNFDIFDFELSDEEMKAIDSININSRLRYDPDNCDFSIL